ncbi:MAG TPA: branched-chain amino acid ABC transporter permease, partial [Candidatus Bathyarchaeia archaeon]|nr:branched-chain amino acid ABC transporter permease [Candidatus Bathyarchaeia archaeon]
MTKFLQTLMDGVAVGSLYALIALGYTMVYGILQFINFAHSDVFVLGAWVSYTIAVTLGYAAANAEPSVFAGLLILFAAMATCGAVGFTIERLAYRPLRNAPRLNVLITAIGVSLLLQNVGQLPWFFGTQPQRMPSLIEDKVLGVVSGVSIHAVDVIGAGTA